MRLRPIPGPHDALHLVERGAETVNALLDAVPRVTEVEGVVGGTTTGRHPASPADAVD